MRVSWSVPDPDAPDPLPQGPERAFLYEAGVRKDLGVLPGAWSYALAINNGGVVVGKSDYAFVYQNGEMIDLNSLVSLPDGLILHSAVDINDAGQILATTYRPGDDKEYWVRLTPIAPHLR